MNSVNTQFDNRHHSLLDRVEQSVLLLEQSVTELPNPTLNTNFTSPVPTSITNHTSPISTADTNYPSPPTTPETSYTHYKPNKVGPVAIRIMQAWYDRNPEHPYPSYDAAAVIAEASQITVEQVKKWFANRRQRLGNTKKIQEIVRRRKRVRSVSGDNILLEAAKMARIH